LQQGYSDIRANVKRVNIGTTHFINAVIKRKDLQKVVCLRLCGNSTQALPPFSDFPDDLKEVVFGGYHLLNGGFEFDEKVVTEVQTEEILSTLKKLSDDGFNHVAVVGVFSPTNPSHEILVADLIRQHHPEIVFTLSHHLGYLGLLERESAAILNESLKLLCVKTISGFKDAFKNIGLHCPVFFTQNDGTLLSDSQVLQYPIYTFSSGATNSMRGAAHLSGLKDAIIVDIGGTSTDVGVLIKGFPREASTRVRIGGVNTNFRMPDTKSIGLGGGSIVLQNEDGNISVGPMSVEYKLVKEALIFGGSTLVTTDIAATYGLTHFGDPSKVQHLTEEFTLKAMAVIRKKVEETIDQVKLSGDSCTVVLVGGGSILIDTSLPLVGADTVIKPPYFQVANAVGAALSQVSGTYDKLVSLKEGQTREAALEEAKQFAIAECVKAGALKDTIEILDVAEIAMQYVSIPCVRLRVKAVGDLEEHSHFEISRKEVKQGEPALGHVIEVKEEASSQVSSTKKKFDQSPKNSTPFINEKGEWILSRYDVECLAIGAGIRGCGGGGSPYLGRLRLMKCVEKGCPPRVIHPFRMSRKDRASCVAFFGAPEPMMERISSGTELPLAFRMLEKLYGLGFNENITDEDIKRIAESNNLKIWNEGSARMLSVPDSEDEDVSAHRPTAIMCAEIGGLNSMEPLIVGADCDLPILDCDGMGRAFPQLAHFAPFMYGKSPYPAVLTDIHNNNICCVKIDSAPELETVFRNHAIKMGCSAGAGICNVTVDEIRNKTCLFTISRSWRDGDAIMKARRNHTDPVDAIVQLEDGKLLSKGKVLDVKRETTKGYTWGTLIIEGTSEWPSLKISFQNEYIITQNLSTKEILATVPDMICTADVDSGEPITAEELKYGLRIAVFVIPVPTVMNQKQALEYVRPERFGYEGVKYNKLCEYKEMPPFPPLL